MCYLAKIPFAYFYFLFFYLMRDVLLFCRSMTFRINESGVSNQVASVLHYEAPVM